MNTLREAIQDYLQLRRDLGFKLCRAGYSLRNFAAFMEKRQAPFVTEALALAWAQEPANVQPAYWSQRLGYVRAFAKFRKATDSRTEIPAPGLLPCAYKRKSKPHQYSDEDIRNLLRAALEMPVRYERSALLPWVYYCYFGLLFVTGLRPGEARNLELKDVDLESAVLTVRRTKNKRTRLIALHKSTCDVLADYIDRRQRHWEGHDVSSSLFLSSEGTKLSEPRVLNAFRALSRKVGLRGPYDSHGPRLHDFRHSFATTTLANWYRCDHDPERMLPVLSTWLGHVSVADTYWYLEGSPELMREAMTRLERIWEVRS